MLKQLIRVLLLLGITIGCSNVMAEAMEHQDAVAKGKQVFDTRCVQCHGEKADGKGHLIDFLKITPANLTQLGKGQVTERVLKAVLGRHATGIKGGADMPLLKDYLSLEDVYVVSQYIKTLQQ